MAFYFDLWERWQTDDGRHRLAKVAAAATKKEDWAPILTGFPFVEEVKDGRDLRQAPLNDADLQNANLRNANLHEANLNGSDLAGAIQRQLQFPVNDN